MVAAHHGDTKSQKMLWNRHRHNHNSSDSEEDMLNEPKGRKGHTGIREIYSHSKLMALHSVKDPFSPLISLVKTIHSNGQTHTL